MKDTDYQMVEYSNEFSTATAGFNAYDLDVFLVLIYLARQKVPNSLTDKNENLVLTLSVRELKGVLKETGNVSQARIEKAVKRIFDAKFFFRKENYIRYHHLFEELSVHVEKDELNFVVKNDFKDMFFNLTGNFTQHSIIKFNSLKGKYAKRLFQIIMAYRKLGGYEFDVYVFKTMLELPKAYNWADIDKAFAPAVRELKEKIDLESFELIKIKEGRRIVKVNLKWKFKGEEEQKKEEPKTEEVTDLEVLDKLEHGAETPAYAEIPRLTEEEQEMLEWIFENTTVKKLPGRKDTELYVKMARGVIENFQKGEVKING